MDGPLFELLSFEIYFVAYFHVGLSSLTRHYQLVLQGVEVPSVSWLGQLKFKSLVISIVGFRNVFYCLVWAVDLGVQITDEGRSLYIGRFCPAITSLSKYLEEAAFNISISSRVFFYGCFQDLLCA